MILDSNGQPVAPAPEPPEPEPHKFGEFRIPPDAYLSMRAGLNCEGGGGVAASTVGRQWPSGRLAHPETSVRMSAGGQTPQTRS
jgi:hypothetical protein